VRMFQKKMFQDLSEDTILLLCENFGAPCGWFSIEPATCIEDARSNENHGIPVDIDAIRCGRHRLTRYLLPAKARHLYEGMSSEKCVVRLGEAADVGIGYVTGCNSYFHLTTDEAKVWRVHSRYLAPAVLSLKDFHGAIFRHSDWEQLSASGRKTQLLRIPALKAEGLPTGLAEYIAHGKKRRVAEHFKCRVRNPWYAVPHVRVGDAFLSYMSGSSPKLVRNGSGFVAPNTLHIVRFASDRPWKPFVAGWHSSLTKLSCEIEGHALGGGMLKLEPSEAERVLVALPYPKDTNDLVTELDGLLRGGNFPAAQDLADTSVLRRRLGLSKSECMVLRDAAAQLENWRMHK
jgi:adenine-specific DNA-methyltransferase